MDDAFVDIVLLACPHCYVYMANGGLLFNPLWMKFIHPVHLMNALTHP